MDANFWYRKWKMNDIAFHEGKANPLLVSYFNALSIKKGSRVFLPLCGKTLDIYWLLSGGYRVAGAELVEEAVKQLFAELGVNPVVTRAGETARYSAENIDLFVGDIFDLPGSKLGPVDAIYDRAALVALPEEVRARYATHLTKIAAKAPQLLITFEYNQQLMEGPPFSIDDAEIHKNYGDDYHISRLESRDIPGGLKGKCAATEHVWLLQAKTGSTQK